MMLDGGGGGGGEGVCVCGGEGWRSWATYAMQIITLGCIFL